MAGLRAIDTAEAVPRDRPSLPALPFCAAAADAWRVGISGTTLLSGPMTKLLGFLGLTLGGWIGWAIGEPVSFTAALFLSTIGTGVGLYLGRRLARDYF